MYRSKLKINLTQKLNIRNILTKLFKLLLFVENGTHLMITDLFLIQIHYSHTRIHLQLICEIENWIIDSKHWFSSTKYYSLFALPLFPIRKFPNIQSIAALTTRAKNNLIRVIHIIFIHNIHSTGYRQNQSLSIVIVCLWLLLFLLVPSVMQNA